MIKKIIVGLIEKRVAVLLERLSVISEKIGEESAGYSNSGSVIDKAKAGLANHVYIKEFWTIQNEIMLLNMLTIKE